MHVEMLGFSLHRFFVIELRMMCRSKGCKQIETRGRKTTSRSLLYVNSLSAEPRVVIR